MISNGGIGEAMAKSLVACLGTDCSAAAALAAAADLRRGDTLDEGSLRGVPLGSLRRAVADFERRGWLVNQGAAWHVPATGMPGTAPAFLAGMAAMRGPAADEEAALTAVTLPLPPSAVAAALPATGLSYASLVSTDDAMARVASAASMRLTVMTPFLNKGGLDFAISLFERSVAVTRTLVVRGDSLDTNGAAPGAGAAPILAGDYPELLASNCGWLRDIPREGRTRRRPTSLRG